MIFSSVQELILTLDLDSSFVLKSAVPAPEVESKTSKFPLY